jgi:hypothetical protein
MCAGTHNNGRWWGLRPHTVDGLNTQDMMGEEKTRLRLRQVEGGLRTHREVWSLDRTRVPEEKVPAFPI